MVDCYESTPLGGLKAICTRSTLGLTDGYDTFKARIFWNITSDEINDCYHGTCDNETGTSEMIVGIEVSSESGHTQSDDLELGLPRNDGVNKLKSEMFPIMNYVR